MRIMRLALAALFAVLAFSMMASATASAFHPLFITQSGKELLFSGLGGLALLRSGTGTEESIVDCEKTLIHGFALHLSTLAHRIRILFEGKCQVRTGLGTFACATPGSGTHITTKLLLGELGLLTATNHKVLLLLAPQEGTELAEFTCATLTIKVTGAIIGEIPETNAIGEKQINEARNEIELVFASINKTNKQAITEIFLLGAQMAGPINLLNGTSEASEEIKPSPVVKGDGTIEITTTKV